MALFTSIGAAIGAIGTFIGGLGTVGTFMLKTAVGVGLNLLAQAIAGKPQSAASASFGINGTLQSGGDVPRSFILGQFATAGSLVWANTWGQVGETPNAYLTQVIAMADLPGHILDGVLVNGEPVTFGETPHSDYGYPVNEYKNGGVDHLWIKWYDGTQTTADSFLVSTASNANRTYESTRVGYGVPYAIMTAKVSQNMFSGIPSVKFVVSGLPLYDPSKDSTVPGGSGSHRWSNPATWGGDGDHNPVVQIYNLLRGIKHDDQWFYGLQGVTGARLPAAAWIAQIAKCRADNAYRAGGEIPIDVPLTGAVEALLTACQGRISEVGGFYYIHVGEPDAPVASFTDGDILSTEEQSFTPFFGLSDTINGIAATYPSPADGWNEKAAPPLYRTDLEVLAGNRRLMADVALSFVPYPEQVQRLMQSALAEGQRARRHTLVLPPQYWPYAVPGVTLAWTSSRNGYVNKWFRIDGAVDRANLDVMVDLTEVDPDDYDWDSETDFHPPVDGALGTLRPAPQPLVGWQAFPATIGAADKEMPSIRVAFPGNLDDVRAVRVQARIDGDDSPLFDGEVPYGDPATNANPASVVLAGTFSPGADHEVRGRFVPFGSRETEWSEWIPVTTPDVWLTRLEAEQIFLLHLAAVGEEVQAGVAARIRELRDEVQILGDSVISHRIVGDATRASVRTEITERQSLGESFASYKVQTDAVLNDPVTGLGATATGLTALQSRVTATEAEIVAVADDIDSVTAAITDPVTGLVAQSNAALVLQGRVSATEGDISAMEARASLQINVNNQVIGIIDLAGNAIESIITMLSNKFVIAKPDGTGAQQIFTTGTSALGANRIVINGDVFALGSITAQHIAASTLSAIVANLGTVIAGKMQRADGTMIFDLDNKRLKISS